MKRLVSLALCLSLLLAASPVSAKGFGGARMGGVRATPRVTVPRATTPRVTPRAATPNKPAATRPAATPARATQAQRARPTVSYFNSFVSSFFLWVLLFGHDSRDESKEDTHSSFLSPSKS